MTNRHTLNSILYWTLFAIVCGSFCYIMALYPYAQDDLEFLYVTQQIGLKETIIKYFNEDNARIGNTLEICLLQVPKWIPVIIQCVALIIGVLIMANLAGVRRRWKRMTLFLSLFVFAPMWSHSMFCQAYAFNYIVTIPLFFATIYYYNHPEKIPLWAGILLSVITGAWHEGFTLVLLFGWAVMWLFDRTSLNKRNIWYVAGAALGLAWLVLLNPGVWTRQADFHFSLQNSLRLFFDWMYFLYVTIWLICFCFKKTRHAAVSPLPIFALGGFIFIPLVLLTGLEHAAMPAILVCCCAATVLFPVFAWEILGISSRTFKICISIILYVFTSVHLIAVDREASIVLPMYKRMSDTFYHAKPDEKGFFMPIRYAWDAPTITFGRPHKILLDPNMSNVIFARLRAGKRWNLYAIPEELKTYYREIGDTIPGQPHIRLWDGHIISENLADTALVWTETKYKYAMKPERARAKGYVFNGADGKNYVYVIPTRSALGIYLGEPEYITIIH